MVFCIILLLIAIMALSYDWVYHSFLIFISVLTLSWDWNEFCHTDYLFLFFFSFFFLLPQMMCAKMWYVEKELASHQIKTPSSCLNVNAILGGEAWTDPEFQVKALRDCFKIPFAVLPPLFSPVFGFLLNLSLFLSPNIFTFL